MPHLSDSDLDAYLQADAEHILDTLCQDDDSGWPLLTLGPRHPFNRERLIRHAGGVIENEHARLNWKEVDLDLATERLRRAQILHQRRVAEYEHFVPWVERERAKGRAEVDLTWGACVRETGILRETA